MACTKSREKAADSQVEIYSVCHLQAMSQQYEKERNATMAINRQVHTSEINALQLEGGLAFTLRRASGGWRVRHGTTGDRDWQEWMSAHMSPNVDCVLSQSGVSIHPTRRQIVSVWLSSYRSWRWIPCLHFVSDKQLFHDMMLELFHNLRDRFLSMMRCCSKEEKGEEIPV